jgi:hypothetical protein
MTADFRRQGLIENERLEEYDGTTPVVRNENLSADEIEYLRWKAERGMKTRHIPAVFRHDPWFVARNVGKMAVFTYRGSTLRTALGLESDRAAFARYKEIRRREREYVEPPQTFCDPVDSPDSKSESQERGLWASSKEKSPSSPQPPLVWPSPQQSSLLKKGPTSSSPDAVRISSTKR